MATKRGPYAKTDERRGTLSRAALTLVEERGHRRVSVADIAAKAGVSEPSVFYHYPTKETLLIAALHQHDDDHIRAEGEEEGAIEDMGRRAQVGVTREHISLLYGELSGAARDPDHPAHEYFQARWARSIRVIAADVRRLQTLGRARSEIDPELAARLLLATWEGLTAQWHHGPTFDIRSALESSIRLTLGPRVLEPEDDDDVS